MDFFNPIVSPEHFGGTFKTVRESLGYSPAREIIAAMMYYFEDPDGRLCRAVPDNGVRRTHVGALSIRGAARARICFRPKLSGS